MSRLLGTTPFCVMPLDKYQTKEFWQYVERVFYSVCDCLYEADYALEYVDVQGTHNNDGSIHYMSLHDTLEEFDPIAGVWCVIAYRIPNMEVTYIHRSDNVPKAWIYVMNPDGMQDKTLVLFVRKVSQFTEGLKRFDV